MSQKAGKRRQQVLVGEKIRELRKSRSLTQAELAARVGIQQSDLCRMETGEYKVSLDILFRILGVFGMQIGEFFQETARDHDLGEEDILRRWRRLSPRGRDEVREFLIFKTQQQVED